MCFLFQGIKPQTLTLSLNHSPLLISYFEIRSCYAIDLQAGLNLQSACVDFSGFWDGKYEPPFPACFVLNWGREPRRKEEKETDTFGAAWQAAADMLRELGTVEDQKVGLTAINQGFCCCCREPGLHCGISVNVSSGQIPHRELALLLLLPVNCLEAKLLQLSHWANRVLLTSGRHRQLICTETQL